MFNRQGKEPIGLKRHRISIYRAGGDASRDSYGRRLKKGELLAEIWAEKQDWSGTETKEGGKETPSVTTRFIIRYRDDLTPAMIVEEGGDSYDIESVLDLDGTMRDLTLNCRKVAA